MRKPIIIGNWKMHKTQEETLAFVQEVDQRVNSEKMDVGIAPSFLSLAIARANAKKMLIAAQNCHFEESGAFTGEVSIPMLQDVSISWCIVGHSERREMFGDTNQSVNQKVHALLAAGMKVIVCIGESEQAFEAKQTQQVLSEQLEKSLAGLVIDQLEDVVIAYEPIWAIGTGKSANKEIAQKCCHFIREKIKELFGEEAAKKVRLQYGGSVKADNIKEYLSQEDIDGALVGGASLQADSFLALLEAIKGD